MPSIAEYRHSLAEPSALDAALASSFSSKKRMRANGFLVSGRCWKKAKAPQTEGSARRGRPSKTSNAEFKGTVVQATNANSQESSIWLKKQEVMARVLTKSLHSIYWEEQIALKMRWSTFFRLVKAEAPCTVHGQKSTDVCDHCWLLQSSIRPELKKLLTKICQVLESRLPAYWQGFREEMPRQITVQYLKT